MKQLFSGYPKVTTAFAISLFTLLGAATKTNAQWIELGGTYSSTFNSFINSVATNADGNVYTTGFFNNGLGYYVADWNGTAWSQLGNIESSFDSDAQSIATDDSGNVYAAGLIYDYNVNGNFYVAKWNGTAWSELGGAPFSGGAIHSIVTDANGNVYAGGHFTDSSGNYYVAKWNGTAWSELGGTTGAFNHKNVSDDIRTIATDADGNVYAGGGFFDSSGHPYVAKWDGTAWSELGGSAGAFNKSGNGSTGINSIAVDANGNLYAGGYFTDSSGHPYVAKWSGTAWSELGGVNSSSFNNTIFSIAADTVGNVYVGGDFTNANSNNYVAEWNGSAWNELGGTNSSTFNGIVWTIATDTFGNVYTGGGFTDANGRYYVAEYPQKVLPVTLVSITATKEKNGIAITWQTATETNSSQFIVQRSTDGNSFANIGTVKAAGSGANSYRFIDNNPANGINYYRLQNVDNNGSFAYSPIRTVNEAISFSASIYPNPVQNHLSLTLNSDKTKTVQVQIVSNEGKVMTTQQIQVATGVSLQKINTASLSNGAYYIRLVSEDGQTQLKFMKE